MTAYRKLIIIMTLALLPMVCGGEVAGMKAKPSADGSAELEKLLRGKRFWSMAEDRFPLFFSGHLKEIESAKAGRFAKGTAAFALAKMSEDGHFLLVSCVNSMKSYVPCEENRDMLEERVVSISLLESLPVKGRRGDFYDTETWVLTPLGEKYVRTVLRHYPDTWTRLARLVVRIMGHG